MEQISGANLLAMRSLATQSKDSAVTTLGNMDALIQHYVALQTENIMIFNEHPKTAKNKADNVNLLVMSKTVRYL